MTTQEILGELFKRNHSMLLRRSPTSLSYVAYEVLDSDRKTVTFGTAARSLETALARAEAWMREVQTTPANFLKLKFAIQAAAPPAGAKP